MGQLVVKRALLFVIILSKCISNCERISSSLGCGNPIAKIVVTVNQLEIAGYNASGLIFGESNVTYIVSSEGINKLDLINQQLELVWTASTNKEPQMIQSFSYRSMDFLIIGYSVGYSNILIYKNSTWKLQQSIKNFGRTQAASFFIFNSNLYLFIINQKSTEMATSILYKWKRTYFDEVDRVLTISGNGIVSLNYKDNVLIIITQNSIQMPKIGSLVLSMENDKLVNNQHLPSNGPMGVHVFTNNISENFVFINNKTPPQQIYKIKNSKKFVLSTALYEDIFIFGFFTYKDTEFTLGQLKDNSLMLYRINGTDFQKVGIIQTNIGCVRSLQVQVFDSSVFVIFSTENVIRAISFQLDVQTHEICKINPLQSQLEKLKKLQSHNNILLSKLLSQKSKITKKRDVANEPDIDNKILGIMEEIKINLENLEAKPIVISTTDKITGNLIILNNLKIGHLKSLQLNIKTLNDNFWEPNDWLSQGSAQNVTGHVRTQKLIANNLIVNPNKNNFVNDILLTKSEERQVIGRKLNLNTLLAFNINLESINSILFNKIVTIKTQNPITGSKKIQSLKVANLTVLNWNKLNIQDTPEKRSVDIIYLAADLDVENIQVQTINNISFDQMVSSLFLKGLHNEIQGNLNFLRPFYADKVNVKGISNVNVTSFLTRTTDQNITSHIILKSLKSSAIDCNTVNDLEFKENVARADQQNRIISPVSMLSFETLANLSFKGEIDNATWLNMHNHIVGTQESDLLQIYMEPVVIHGTVFLKQIEISEQTQIVIGGDIWVNEMIYQQYWLKSVNQHFSSNVEFKRSLTVPNIKVEILNEHSFHQYLSLGTETPWKGWPIVPTRLSFKNIRVEGDIRTIVQGYHFQRMIDVKELANNAVRYNGTYKIRDSKIFEGQLIIKNLLVENINNSPVRTLSKLKVENVILGDVEILNETKVHIKTLSNSRPVSEKHLNRTEVQGKTLLFKTINGHDWEKIQNLSKSNLPLNHCVVNGNVTFESLKTKQINNFTLENLIPRNNISKIIISGSKKFLASNFKINNLVTPSINNISFEFIKKQTFSKTQPQVITANFTFQNITTPFIEAEIIDSLEINNVLDKSSSEKQILNVGTLKLRSADVKGSLQTKTIYGETFKTLTDTYQMLNGRRFSRLMVLGNITVPETRSLLDVFKNSIHANRNTEINGTIYFRNRVLVKNLRTRKYIHDINLKKIQDDALFSNKDNQIIQGNVIFKYDLFSQNSKIQGFSKIPIVNNIDMDLLDHQLIRINTTSYEVIRGKKHFTKPISIKKLQVPNRIHGVLPEMIVSTLKAQIIPAAYFTNLTILNNLHMFYVNDLNFTNFLLSRVVKSSKQPQHMYGKLKVNNVVLSSGTFSKLNDIDIKNVVTDSGSQDIDSAVIFKEPIRIAGALNIDYLNNVNIKEAFKNAILIDEDVNFKGNILFKKASAINAPIKTEFLNKFKFEDLYQRLDFPLEIPELVRKVHKDIFDGMKLTENMASKYLYLENLDDFRIPEFNVDSIQSTTIDDSILFHLRGKVPGNYCNLDLTCSCPVQYDFQYNSNGDVNIVDDLKFERTFSFKNENQIVNIVTNTLSSSDECSNSLINESSQIIWFNSVNDKNRDNSDNLFLFDPKKIPNYLSDVVYFEEGTESYIVMAFYFSADSKSHNLNSLVLKLSPINNSVQLVQQIPSFGVEKLNILKSPQGIVLILANTMDSGLKTIETPVYRFDPTIKKFSLIREIFSQNGFGTISSGVLSNGGSIIALGERYTPSVLIFNYNSNFDSYYFYQGIYFDTEVTSTSIFYSGRDMFLSAVTKDGQFYLFEYKYFQGFVLKTKSELENSKLVLPFEQKSNLYLLATTNLTLAKIYKPIILGIN